MRRILVTGASGFVGRLLVQRLGDAGFPLTLAGRTATAVQGDNSRSFAVGGVDRNTDWRPALEDCDAVIHLAAQVPGPGVTDEVFSEVNDRGTARLVEQAASSGARQFVLMSSLSAVSDNSSSAAINEQTLPEPSTSYGRSKLAGESHMVMFEGRDRIAITIRPPIVYGAGAQGNWLLLQRLAATRVPLPFGSINNCRTLIAAENLVDALVRVVSMPEPKSGTFLVSDGESISLREILTWLRKGMGIPPRLVPIPSSALNALLHAVGRERIAKSLLGDLQVDSSLFRNTFGWSPQLHPSEAIVRSGASFKR